MLRDIRVPSAVLLAVAAVVLVVSGVALGAVVVGRQAPTSYNGMMGGANGAGMMGGNSNGSNSGMMGGTGASATSQPGTAGFVPGTSASPRVIRVYAGPGYTFSPSSITVARGETVTFVVTTMGPLVHEFMVGPADAVAADRDGTPEVADIGMMQTKSLTYTFDGSGPYAYACHADGHYEGGMRGTISVVG
jgi:plastocyanin